jgi:hypothetical protein
MIHHYQGIRDILKPTGKSGRYYCGRVSKMMC